MFSPLETSEYWLLSAAADGYWILFFIMFLLPNSRFFILIP
jgi:hypothetical protein